MQITEKRINEQMYRVGYACNGRVDWLAKPLTKAAAEEKVMLANADAMLMAVPFHWFCEPMPAPGVRHG